MSLGFEVTEDDIETVLANYGVQISLASISDDIDLAEVSRVALDTELPLDGDDEDALNRQTDTAHDEIARQLIVSGVIPRIAVAKAGNDALLGLTIPEGALATYGSLQGYKEALLSGSAT